MATLDAIEQAVGIAIGGTPRVRRACAMLALAIARLGRGGSQATTRDALGRVARMSARSVSRYLARLIAAGLVEARQTRHGLLGRLTALATRCCARRPEGETASAQPTWSDASVMLRSVGLALHERACVRCRVVGLTPGQVVAYARCYLSHRDARGWRGPGVLFARLMRARPRDDPWDLRLWVPAEAKKENAGETSRRWAEEAIHGGLHHDTGLAQPQQELPELLPSAQSNASAVAAARDAALRASEAERRESERRIVDRIGAAAAALLRRALGTHWWCSALVHGLVG